MSVSGPIRPARANARNSAVVKGPLSLPFFCTSHSRAVGCLGDWEGPSLCLSIIDSLFSLAKKEERRNQGRSRSPCNRANRTAPGRRSLAGARSKLCLCWIQALVGRRVAVFLEADT